MQVNDFVSLYKAVEDGHKEIEIVSSIGAPKGFTLKKG